MNREVTITCERCKGKGFVVMHGVRAAIPCPRCSGTGMMRVIKKGTVE